MLLIRTGVIAAGPQTFSRTQVNLEYLKHILMYTRRYSPLRGLTSSSCGGFWPSTKAFFAHRAKKDLYTLCVLTLGHFWCSVIISVTFSSNLSNFEKNPKIQKNPKMSKKNLSY